MTETLPSLELALLLGLRHGLVPDHLAVVDGLTMRARPASAPWMGALFSLGHGCVLLAMVALAGYASSWITPGAATREVLELVEWLPGVLLLGLAALNAYTLLDRRGLARSHPMSLLVRPQGGDGAWGAWGAWGAFGIGMLFAFGLESLLHAVAWGGAATALGGSLAMSLKVAGAFVLGMTITDALDGYATARIAATASHASVQSLRRKLGWPIVLLCVISGLQLLAAKVSDDWMLHERWMGTLGVGMVLLTVSLYAFAILQARRPQGAV